VIAYEIEKTDPSVAGNGEDPNRTARRDTSHLYVQSALLYSTSEGERRIRVHNVAIPVTNMKHLPFEYIDVTAMSHYFCRLALSRVGLILVLLIIAINKCEFPSFKEHNRNALNESMQIND
jgi:hypothetical protein